MKPSAPPAAATSTRRPRVPRPEREEQLLAAAERVFAQCGYQATSMEQVAAAVGVTKPMIYEYFGSKDGLLRACLARAGSQLRDATSEAVRCAGSPSERLERSVGAFFAFVDEHAAAWAVLQSEALLTSGPGAGEIERIRRQRSDDTAALLAAMPGAPSSPVTVQLRAAMVTGACERVAVWRTGRPGALDAAAATREVMAVLWPGLSASGPAAPWASSTT